MGQFRARGPRNPPISTGNDAAADEMGQFRARGPRNPPISTGWGGGGGARGERSGGDRWAYAGTVATTAVNTPTFRARDLRIMGAGMLGLAAIWPALPVHPPLACPLRATTGIPCPFCGMTRAVVAAVHGDLAASLRYNPAGAVAVVLAAVVLLVPRLRQITLPRLTLPIAGAVLWAWNLTLNPTF